MFLLEMDLFAFLLSPPPPHQAACTVFEKSIRTLLHDFGPMVAQLSGMLGQIYSTFPQASALDLARQVDTHPLTGEAPKVSDIYFSLF